MQLQIVYQQQLYEGGQGIGDSGLKGSNFLKIIALA